MPETIPGDSVGIVETQIIHFSEPLTLECGKTLSEYDIAYETYGELNPGRSNAFSSRPPDDLRAMMAVSGSLPQASWALVAQLPP